MTFHEMKCEITRIASGLSSRCEMTRQESLISERTAQKGFDAPHFHTIRVIPEFRDPRPIGEEPLTKRMIALRQQTFYRITC
jgi:hypothetical protein